MSTNTMKHLSELQQLHNDGVITDAEYLAAKARLADSLLTESNDSRASGRLTGGVGHDLASMTPPSSATPEAGIPANPTSLLKRPIKLRWFIALILGLTVLNFIWRSLAGGDVRQSVTPTQQAVTKTQGRSAVALTQASSSQTSDTTGTASPPPTEEIVPTSSPEELLKKVDEFWAASDWMGIVQLLQYNSIARGDPTLQEKLYAAFINYGQVEMDAGRLAVAETQFKNALSINTERGIAQVKIKEAQDRQVRAERDQAQAQHDSIAEKMVYYSGDGDAVVAVSKVIAQGYFNTGYSTYRPNRPNDDQYLLIAVAVQNDSNSVIHANPNNFTLLNDGYTMNPESEMYTMTNYFDATDLQPGTYSNGWLLFLAPKAETYTLVYQGIWDDVVRKEIVVTERR